MLILTDWILFYFKVSVLITATQTEAFTVMRWAPKPWSRTVFNRSRWAWEIQHWSGSQRHLCQIFRAPIDSLLAQVILVVPAFWLPQFPWMSGLSSRRQVPGEFRRNPYSWSLEYQIQACHFLSGIVGCLLQSDRVNRVGKESHLACRAILPVCFHNEAFQVSVEFSCWWSRLYVGRQSTGLAPSSPHTHRPTSVPFGIRWYPLLN